jgi:N-acetylmuramoyl-L-alanine amidase
MREIGGFILNKINLVISPSQQFENHCKMGDTEADHTRKIATMIYKNLSKIPSINLFLVPVSNKERDTARLRDAVSMSNDFIKQNGGTGYHFAIHTDAGGYATGASLLYKSEEGKKFGTPIIENIMQLTPWNDVGLKVRNGLYELNKTLAYAALIEISFHDSSKEARWIHENMQTIADVITDGILKGLGLT